MKRIFYTKQEIREGLKEVNDEIAEIFFKVKLMLLLIISK